MKTRIPALIPAIFTTRSVCLAGSGITSGSSVAAAEAKRNKSFKVAHGPPFHSEGMHITPFQKC